MQDFKWKPLWFEPVKESLACRFHGFGPKLVQTTIEPDPWKRSISHLSYFTLTLSSIRVATEQSSNWLSSPHEKWGAMFFRICYWKFMKSAFSTLRLSTILSYFSYLNYFTFTLSSIGVVTEQSEYRGMRMNLAVISLTSIWRTTWRSLSLSQFNDRKLGSFFTSHHRLEMTIILFL